MKKVPLIEACKVTMGQAPKGSSYNNNEEGIPLVAGASDFGRVNPEPSKYTKEPTRISGPGDIIMCIRATIGNLNWSDKEYCLGRGVAGIRPTKGKSEPNYLWHCLQANAQVLTSKGRGSTFAQVSRADIESLEIPLPPLPEQKRIAAILDKADAIRKKRQQALRLADDFLKSAFLDMFGDPVTNPKGWSVDKFGNVGELDRGKSRHRPRNAPELLGGPYPLIQTGDVAKAAGYIRGYTQTYSEMGFAQSKMWPIGTLCITIAANIAKTAILTIKACFPDSVVGFKPNDKVRTEYIQYWLSFLQKILEESAPESAQKNINLEILRMLDIPVPSIDLQDQFVAIVQNAESIKYNMRIWHEQDDELFNSLVQQAFRGEL